MVSSKTKASNKHKTQKNYRSSNRSANRSLKRYISSTEAKINKSKNYMAGSRKGSRNTQFRKSQRFLQNEKKFGFETKTQPQFYGSIHKNDEAIKTKDDPLNRTQQLALNGSDYIDHTLKRTPSQKHDVENSKNAEYYNNKDVHKRECCSVSESKVYRDKDSRHLSEQNRPSFLANMLK